MKCCRFTSDAMGLAAGLLLWQISSTIDGHINGRVTTGGQTPSCEFLNSPPYSPSPAGQITATSTSFIDVCGNTTDFVVLGTDLLSVGRKCCLSASELVNVSSLVATANLTMIPPIMLVPLVDHISRDGVNAEWLQNCPKLSGKVVPLGFYMSLFGSLIGTLFSLLLNGLEYVWLRVRNVNGADGVSPVEQLLKPHALLYVKTFITVAAGTVIAIADAASLASSNTIFFSQYAVFCGVVVHGAVAKSLCDYFSMFAAWYIVDYAVQRSVVNLPRREEPNAEAQFPRRAKRGRAARGEDPPHDSTDAHIVVVSREPIPNGSASNFQMKKLPSQTWNAIMAIPLPQERDPFEAPSSVGCKFLCSNKLFVFGIFVLVMPILPPLATHIAPGIVFYFLPVAIVAAACSFLVWMITLIISRWVQSPTGRVLLGSLAAALFNFFVHLALRMAFSYMSLAYGKDKSLFPYVGPSASGWGSLWVERAYFFFQISSNACYALYAVESLQRSVELVIVVL